MRLEALIASRYLFAQKHRSVVTVISWVSLIGLMVSTAALIVVLSVYNGIGEVTRGLFGTFDPELVVEPAEGKTFRVDEKTWRQLQQVEGVKMACQMVSETAWLTYGDNQAIVTLRGVDSTYRLLSGLDTLISEGHYTTRIGELATLVVGGEVWYSLGIRMPSNTMAAVHIPRRGTASMGYSLDQAFRIGYALPVGNFFIQQDIDQRYVVADIDFVRGLTDYAPDECTAIALKVAEGEKVERAKCGVEAWTATTGEQLTVKDRYDQQPLYFKIFRTERLGIYLILALIVLISTLSLVASLSLLIINKRHDVFTLRSLGMTTRRLQLTFLAEGLLICGIAVAAGLLIGFAVSFVQQQWGIITMGDGNFVTSAFPVAIRGLDFLWTFLLVMTLSSLSVGLTVRHAQL
ncbi:MAG: ABC transporter permease [Bacteroidales bacterium]|nr:ABC transporter permease [Bacteroidales bacterium]